MDYCRPIDELTLSQTDRSLVIITDEPGIGKTTSLARLSMQIKSAWVVYIELKNFQAHLDRLPDELTNKNVSNFPLGECCTSADGSHGLLEYLLHSNTYSGRLVLMFDGFDQSRFI